MQWWRRKWLVLNMRKILLYSNLLLLCVGFIHETYAQYVFTKQNNNNNWFKGIYEDSITKNLFISSTLIYYSSTSVNARSTIYKIDKNGLMLDSINVDSCLMLNSPISKIGGNYYLHGSQVSNKSPSTFKSIPVIYKLDTNFNVLKKVVLDSSFTTDDVLVNSHLLQKNSRLYIAFALMNYSKIRVFKLDFGLNKLDSLTFNGSFTCDIANYGNNMLLTGSGFPIGSIYGNNQVAELDTSFNFISRFNLDSITSLNPGCLQKIGITYGHTNIYELNPNKYFVSGYYNVVYNNSCQKYSKNIIGIISNNSVVKKSNIIGKPGANTLYTMPYTSSHKKYNYIYTIGMYGYNLSNPYPPQSSPTEIMVNKLDTAGNIVWVNYYSTPNYYYSPLGVYGTADSGVVVTGMRYDLASPAVTGACEGFVLKLDKNGAIQYTGINDKNITQTFFIKVYPNPVSDNLHFKIDDSEEFTLEFFNSLGQLVLRKSDVKETLTLSVKELEQGLYNYKLSSKSHIFTGKFVKE